MSDRITVFVLAACLAAMAPAVAIAQKGVLVVVPDGSSMQLPDRPVELRSGTSLAREKLVILGKLLKAGHLEAAYDSCFVFGDTTTCALHVGPAYRWARLSSSGVDRAIATEARFRDRYFNGQPIVPIQVARLFEKLLDLCENTGYPFASIGLDSLQNTGEGLDAVVKLDKGVFVKVDSVVLKGNAKVSDRFLQAQIGIRPGDPYNESLIAAAELRLKEVPFISQRQRPHVLFTPDRTKLYLFLDARKASAINGILGIAPDATGTVYLTGDLDLRLRNALRRGEAIELNWRSLKDRTQDLKVRFNIPYLLRTPFGTDLSLKLFKRDTTFLEVNSRLAIEYLFGRNDKVVGFVNNKNSQRIGQTQFMPVGLADVRLVSYGLGIARDRFDYRFNPRRGLGIAIDASVGRKRSATAVITDTEPAPAVNSVQYEGNCRVVVHLPLARRSTIRLAATGGSMINENLYNNELFRIGGIRDMRGADETSIYCSSFGIGTLEYRFLFEENSNFFAFVDQGWWEDQSREVLLTDAPLGFGVGTSFETKAGIFSLSYALGKQFSNPIELRNAKVHFGFTSLF